MPSYASYNSLGNTIESNEITDLSVTYEKLESVLKFKELSRNDFTAQSSISFTGLTAYKRYKIVIQNLLCSNVNATPFMRFNNDATAKYGYKQLSGSAVVTTTGAPSIVLGTNFSSINRASGEININGKGATDSDYRISGQAGGIGGILGNSHLIAFDWGTSGANTQINRIDFGVDAGTITGEIIIFGAD